MKESCAARAMAGLHQEDGQEADDDKLGVALHVLESAEGEEACRKMLAVVTRARGAQRAGRSLASTDARAADWARRLDGTCVWRLGPQVRAELGPALRKKIPDEHKEIKSCCR